MQSISDHERWLPVVGYEDLYEVSDHGHVRRLAGGRNAPAGAVLGGWTGSGGYTGITLTRAGKQRTLRVHVLVLEAFVGPRARGHECRHLNGNPADNRLGNLAWGTHAENAEDCARHGTLRRGERTAMAKLTDVKVLEIRQSTDTVADLARRHGVSPSCVAGVRTGRNWKHL